MGASIPPLWNPNDPQQSLSDLHAWYQRDARIRAWILGMLTVSMLAFYLVTAWMSWQ